MTGNTSEQLTAKEAAVIGVFSLLMQGISIAAHYLCTSPLSGASSIASAIAALVGAPLYFEMACRIGKPGVMRLLSVATGIVCMLMGHALMLPYMLLVGAVAEAIVAARSPASGTRRHILAFTVYSVLQVLGAHAPLYLVRAGYQVQPTAIGQAVHFATLSTLSPGSALVSAIVAAFCAAVGGAIGVRLIRRHCAPSSVATRVCRT